VASSSPVGPLASPCKEPVADHDVAFLPTTFDVGIVDCVFKPVDPDILKSKVRVFAELSEKLDH
jgi:response regulator of citrate/malate metabolism